MSLITFQRCLCHMPRALLADPTIWSGIISMPLHAFHLWGISYTTWVHDAYSINRKSCRASTKAQSQEACFSWTSDTGKWTLTWYVLAPLHLNPWKCINPFLGDPIRVRTTFLTKFYNKTGTIMPSFLKVFNPLFSGPIRVRATFLSKSYNKTGTITSSFLKVSNPLFNVPTRVRTTFLTKTYNKTGTITSSFLKVSSPLFSGPVGDRTTFLIKTYNKTGIITS